MANTKVIKQKIKAITSIKKITKTMEMVAFSKMKKSVGVVGDIKEYIAELKKVLELVSSENIQESILFNNSKNNSEKELVIIFASNKGLAGSFNLNIYKETKKLLEYNPNIQEAICFGKFAEKTARKLGLDIKLSYIDIEKVGKVGQIASIEHFVRDLYLKNELKKIHVVYTAFHKMGTYEPIAQNIYPIDKKLGLMETNSNQKNKQLVTFEPSPKTIIDKVIPQIIKILLFSYLLESRASENSSRSFAMKRANESAGEILGVLKLKFNKIRQESITAEIAEISAGAQSS